MEVPSFSHVIDKGSVWQREENRGRRNDEAQQSPRSRGNSRLNGSELRWRWGSVSEEPIGDGY